VIDHFRGAAPEYVDTELSGQAGTAAIAIAILVTSFVVKEFSDGAIRNKISSGAKRSDIFLASVITMCIAAFIMQAISMASVIISGNAFTAGFQTSFKDIVMINLCYLIAVLAITVFDTALMFIMSGNNVSLFAVTILAVIVKLASIMILEDLYPESGEVIISGSRLEVFTFIDKYVPFMHLLGFPRFNWDAYLIGGAVLTVVSIILGLVIFEKKDLK
jgi:ABC-type transport system involved in multi-copper enzyme maturation permease subunit